MKGQALIQRLKQYFDDSPRGEVTRIAGVLGISQPYMSLIISGQRRPAPELAAKISREVELPELVSHWYPELSDALLSRQNEGAA